MRNRPVVGMLAAVALSLSIAACSSDSSDTKSTAQVKPSSSSAMMDEPFGNGCAAVPTDASDPGSFAGMAKDPVATAASNNPVLKTLVAAVTKAQLGDTLNNAKDITVFAPIDTAFAKIPADQLNAVLADDAKLKSILTYHVVSGKLTPQQLAGTHATLQGGNLTITGSGTDFTVNGSAKVVCGNVPTANATVYLIDSVLMPAS